MDARKRREHLKQYLVACVRDNALSWEDLVNPDKLLSVLSRDMKAVLQELGRAAGANLLQLGASLLASAVGKLRGPQCR